MSTVRKFVEIKHVSVYSAFRLGLSVSLILSLIYLLVLSLVYLFLDVSGVMTSLNDVVSDLSGLHIDFISVLTVSVGLLVLNLLLVTGVFVVSTLMYNLCVQIVGGLEIIFKNVDK